MMRNYVPILCALPLAAAACSDGPTAPKETPGNATLRIVAAADANLGAVRLEITGGEADSVTAIGDVLVFGTKTQNGYAIALFGDLASGPFARVMVPDLGALATYTVRITALADRENDEVTAPGSVEASLTQ